MTRRSGPFRHYACFSGRLKRSKFWPIFTFSLVMLTSISVVVPPVGALIAILLALPLAGASTRRMHDAGLSGLWLLPLVLIPAAMLVVLVLGNSMLVLILVAAIDPTVSDSDFSSAFVTTETILFWVLGISAVASCLALAWKGTSGPNRFGSDSQGVDPNTIPPNRRNDRDQSGCQKQILGKLPSVFLIGNL